MYTLLLSTIANMKYEEAKKYIFARCTPVSKAGKVSYSIGDIAVEAYIKLDDRVYAKVLPSFVASWKTSNKKVMLDALQNTMETNEPKSVRFPKWVYVDFMKEDITVDVNGVCITNKEANLGAVTVFLPGVAQRLHDILKEDFYIAFTSIHEAIIHRKSDVTPDLIKKILECVPIEEKDFLSHCVYEYTGGVIKPCELTV